MKAGMERIATETGAGQWGSALAFATMLYDLECTVYMVGSSYYQKPYRKSMMNVWGAECIPSPSTRTNAGKAVLEKDPDTPGRWVSRYPRQSRTQQPMRTPTMLSVRS
jgi:tryptophan synthase beta chain